MNLRRGGIYWFDFAEGASVPIKKKRPCLVVQNDLGNQYAPHTIIVAIRDDAKKALPVQVAVPKGVGGLAKDSVIDCGFMATITKNGLGSCLGQLPPEYMAQVDVALKRSLALR